MTRNTLSYLELQEKKRSNLVNESIKRRELENAIRKVKNDWMLGLKENDIKKLANDQLNTRELQKIAETVRSNLVKEQETYRSNTADEAERYRHNLVMEYLGRLENDLKKDLTDKNNATQLKSSLINLGGAIARGLGASVLGYVLGSKGNGSNGSGGEGGSYTYDTTNWNYALDRTKSISLSDLQTNLKLANNLAAITAGLGAMAVGAPMVVGFSQTQRDGKASSIRKTNGINNSNRHRYGVEDSEGSVNFNEIPRDTSSSMGPGYSTIKRGGNRYETITGEVKKASQNGYSNQGVPSTRDGGPSQSSNASTRERASVYYSPGAKVSQNSGPGVAFS